MRLNKPLEASLVGPIPERYDHLRSGAVMYAAQASPLTATPEHVAAMTLAFSNETIARETARIGRFHTKKVEQTANMITRQVPGLNKQDVLDRAARSVVAPRLPEHIDTVVSEADSSFAWIARLSTRATVPDPAQNAVLSIVYAAEGQTVPVEEFGIKDGVPDVSHIDLPALAGWVMLAKEARAA